jgi:hypothetical protein
MQADNSALKLHMGALHQATDSTGLTNSLVPCITPQ